MNSAASRTLRLNMPQWQGGNNPGYHFGSQLLSFLAPPATGPVETVSVPPPHPDETLSLEDGIIARNALLRQLRSAKGAIERHSPERIVTLGGDCLVSLAPFAYLSKLYEDTLGVLWVDAHPDVMRAEHCPHAHAHVLGMLMGHGDSQFTAEVDVPIRSEAVMYAGLNDWQPAEDEIIRDLALKHTTSDQIARSSKPILDWVATTGVKQVAIHFDLDVLSLASFRAQLFHMPGMGPDPYPHVPKGTMTPDQLVKLLRDVADVCDVVGLTIAEHLPWDTMAMRDMLADLPLLGR